MKGKHNVSFNWKYTHKKRDNIDCNKHNTGNYEKASFGYVILLKGWISITMQNLHGFPPLFYYKNLIKYKMFMHDMRP